MSTGKGYLHLNIVDLEESLCSSCCAAGWSYLHLNIVGLEESLVIVVVQQVGLTGHKHSAVAAVLSPEDRCRNQNHKKLKTIKTSVVDPYYLATLWIHIRIQNTDPGPHK